MLGLAFADRYAWRRDRDGGEDGIGDGDLDCVAGHAVQAGGHFCVALLHTGQQAGGGDGGRGGVIGQPGDAAADIRRGVVAVGGGGGQLLGLAFADRYAWRRDRDGGEDGIGDGDLDCVAGHAVQAGGHFCAALFHTGQQAGGDDGGRGGVIGQPGDVAGHIRRGVVTVGGGGGQLLGLALGERHARRRDLNGGEGGIGDGDLDSVAVNAVQAGGQFRGAHNPADQKTCGGDGCRGDVGWQPGDVAADIRRGVVAVGGGGGQLPGLALGQRDAWWRDLNGGEDGIGDGDLDCVAGHAIQAGGQFRGARYPAGQQAGSGDGCRGDVGWQPGDVAADIRRGVVAVGGGGGQLPGLALGQRDARRCDLNGSEGGIGDGDLDCVAGDAIVACRDCGRPRVYCGECTG